MPPEPEPPYIVPEQYGGKIIQTGNVDPPADVLAEKLGGQSRVRFEKDPLGREFDTVSDQFVGQTKASGKKSPSGIDRRQMKATFIAAKTTGRRPYFQYRERPPSRQVLDVIKRYEQRYGIKAEIEWPQSSTVPQ